MQRQSQTDAPGSSDSPRRRVRLGRIALDALAFTDAIDAISRLVDAGRGGTVFTPNVDHFVLAEQDDRFRTAYEHADLVLVDGTPVLWAARLIGSPLPEKVSGSDLLLPLAERAAQRGWRIYLLGGAPGVAQRVQAALERDFHGIRVVGTSCPVVDTGRPVSEQAAVLDAIRAAQPHVLFLALGSPKQEVWAHQIRDVAGPMVIIGVGATFDFVAGAVRRAPRWISDLGFEWLYRLAREPRRLWKRYLLRDPRFALIVARQLRHRRA